MTPLRASWKRLDYLAHRWIGIILGSLVFVWFASGIVMVFYPWPAFTESQRLSLLSPFEPASSLVGVQRASAVAIDYLQHADVTGVHAVGLPIRARLMRWGDRLVYQFWGEQGGRFVPAALVDAATGESLSPVTSAMAIAAARARVSPALAISEIDRLTVGDHYMMNSDYAAEFPAYRVEFADPARTAVYVSARAGDPFGAVTTRTRLTTWFGTVPHWFYFQWLYNWHSVWNGVNIVVTSIGTLLALTGIVFGLAQLRFRRARGAWLTPYHGVSKWHHLAGLVFGIIVLTWTFSAIWQNLGGDNLPRAGQDALARGAAMQWNLVVLTEAQALARVRLSTSDSSLPLAIDLIQVRGAPGYDLHLADGHEYWVDAATGLVRGEMNSAEALSLARSILPGERTDGVDRINRYDFYYYARPGREMHLPAWRVRFADRERRTLYLDAVSGTPVGFVDGDARRTRWLRDALHSFDYPFLNERRWLWYVVVLPLLFGGLVSTGTGVVLLLRRTRAIQRRRVLARPRAVAVPRSDPVRAEFP